MDAIKLLNRSMKHRLAVLRQNATLEDASIEALHRLTEVAAPLRLRKGATLWQEGDHATFITALPEIRTMSGRKGLQIEDIEALNVFLQTAQQEERSSQ